MVEQSSQGNFVPGSRRDILVEVIGRPEHCGRVRATGKGVGNKQYFRAAPRHSSSETKPELMSKIRQDLMEEMRKKIERVRLE